MYSLFSKFILLIFLYMFRCLLRLYYPSKHLPLGLLSLLLFVKCDIIYWFNTKNLFDATSSSSSMLTTIYEKGFTEPDPRYYLSTIDIARKVTFSENLESSIFCPDFWVYHFNTVVVDVAIQVVRYLIRNWAPSCGKHRLVKEPC